MIGVAMGSLHRVAGGLLERDHELETVSGLLNAVAAGQGAVVLIEGPAGIGKSSLLHASAGVAERREFEVLRVRGDELVMESSLAAVRDLFWPQVRSAGMDAL